VGTRPNIMKVAPLLSEFKRRSRFESILVHTGQHYDDSMSSVFLTELEVGAPDYVLDVGSGTHAQQTARVMERLEPLLEELQADLVIVPGDVNSTLAAALTAAKLQIPIAHLEAGLRSFDRSMPEEINRIVADALSDLHLIHSPEARENLLREGIHESSIRAVGNTMIDTLVALRRRPEVLCAPGAHGLVKQAYLLVTLHRPALVDGPLLGAVLARLAEIARELPVVFPIHPRTRRALDRLDVAAASRLMLLPPLGYLEFLGLMASAAGVLTDSGGVQEETTVLGVPCFTLRANTERPSTVTSGTNTVLGLEPSRITEIPRLLEASTPGSGAIPELWDGHAAERVAEAVEEFLSERTRP